MESERECRIKVLIASKIDRRAISELEKIHEVTCAFDATQDELRQKITRVELAHPTPNEKSARSSASRWPRIHPDCDDHPQIENASICDWSIGLAFQLLPRTFFCMIPYSDAN
jgi:hypothetical protein